MVDNVSVVNGVVELYGWEKADGTGKSDKFYGDYQYVKQHCEQYGLRVIVHKFEFADSEMLDDFTGSDPDAEPHEFTHAGAFCRWVNDSTEPGRTLAAGWEQFTRELTSPADDQVRKQVYVQLLRLSRIEARKLGAEEGTAGASWVFDGTTDQARYERCLRLDEDGDPAWHDEFGPSGAGPLSGEHADGRTPATLLADIGVAEILSAEDPGGEAGQEIADAYEEAFGEAWSQEVLRVARYHTTGEETEGTQGK